MDRGEGEANKLYSENAKASVLCMLCVMASGPGTHARSSDLSPQGAWIEQTSWRAHGSLASCHCL